MRAAWLLAVLVSGAACGKRAADPATAGAPAPVPAASATPAAQGGAKAELLTRDQIEAKALDAATRLQYHAGVVESAVYDPASDSWRVTVACGNAQHQVTSLALVLDARSGLVRRHRAATGTKPDTCPR